MFLKNCYFLIICFIISCSFAFNPNEEIEMQIVGVKDGDTYVGLKVNGEEKEEVTIRLAHVDCPEKKQAFGNKAKQFGSDFCYGKTAKIVSDGKRDRYHRLIAEIYVDDKCLNKELVKAGLAWHFKKYSNSEEYANLELEAREKKIGLWIDENPIAPWDSRHLTK